MGLFGWSLPPGCGTLPGEEEDYPCEVCGKHANRCICPECPECSEFGRAQCYELRPGGCGMIRTEAQAAAMLEFEAAQQAQAERESEWAMQEDEAMRAFRETNIERIHREREEMGAE